MGFGQAGLSIRIEQPDLLDVNYTPFRGCIAFPKSVPHVVEKNSVFPGHFLGVGAAVSMEAFGAAVGDIGPATLGLFPIPPDPFF